MHRITLRAALVVAAAVAALTASVPTQAAPPSDRYAVTNLVSNVTGVAPVTDPDLRNAWGLARSATSPWWVSDNDTNKSTLYNGAGVKQGLTVGVAGGPTGVVFSGISGQFQVGTATAPTTLGTSLFIFDSQDGKIRAWRGGSTALVTADRSPFGASYLGLAISNGAPGPRLYAADFANGRVDVFNGSWTLVTAPGAFTDPKLPDNYSPFGIQTIGSRVFVGFALRGADGDEVHAQGKGIVDVFDLDGGFLGRVAQHGSLNAPWGLAQAPADWGAHGGDLLVGSFGDGTISAYKELPNGNWASQGQLRDEQGQKLTIDGLWALQFGNAGNNGDPQTLYFTAGPNDENDGLFGTIKLAG